MYTQIILSYRISGNEKEKKEEEEEEKKKQRIKDYLGCILKIYRLIKYQVMRRRRRRCRELRIT